ncbi:MAG: hypothetical protein LBU34_03140 [Planctomycetaceae bacterium]|jgi:DNA-binding CsgD family transcriptional regulator|nr:hypothetical protein [Planctomycetaceae bacterium]
MTKQTEKIRNEIIRLRESGKTLSYIAKCLGCSIGAVHLAIQRHAPHLTHAHVCYANIRDDIIADYKAGYSYRELTEKYNITAYFIKKTLGTEKVKRLCIIKRKKKAQQEPKEKIITPHQIKRMEEVQKRTEKILALYHKGNSVQKIAAALRIRKPTIRGVLRAAGINFSPPIVKTERNLAIVESRRSGKNFGEIAEQFNISRQRVYQLFEKYTNPLREPDCVPSGGKWHGKTGKSRRLWKTVTQWHREGKSYEQIAKLLNIRCSTLKGVIYEYRKTYAKDIYQKPPKKYLASLNKAVEMRKSGMILSKIAKALSVSSGTVHRWLEESNEEFPEISSE